MRLVFAGTPEPAVIALRALLESDHEILAVVTRPDAPKGRGRTLHPSPVAELAEAHGLEILKPTTLNPESEEGQAFRQRLMELAPDCVPVVAYGNLLPESLLSLVPHGFINLHFSLLPRWRGAAPVQAAIAAGDRVTGATTFRIDSGLDTGEILGTVTEEINATDTAADLLDRLAHSGAQLLERTVSGLENDTIMPEQQTGEASYAKKITPSDARINWSDAAESIDRHIRAVTPAPGAWTTLNDQRVKLEPVKTITLDANLEPGEIAINKKTVVVGTGSTTVQLSRIQVPGKKMMDAADWGRGLGTTEGLRFQ
ncbi:methionyl-tRNA formyltransferase [Corynebacterium mustelae]|uniref:Methionyl-tRNA formyltransferase n=1 Tax=Corynebacterium mustelae TaxID=571915 RepID=A0A0G3GZP9_9CORY|nr:methionyl-tRNA formyltransferase [Corynebacterium mustelae]AKK06020.1 methionyl-tRNA formyltransferase [Corynebacterium mustelae]